ncbi:hypothetical protein N3K66_006758 [Trichothecium roseum]|uniref:Uncharacterized protein n=1 Tax=Trichothecium roseum TaxID=47278 RepID=A0ACC0UYU7_9HYPO|nr:hypothetical protein N3K66_006758 [Trichothecium roseum]
MTSSQTESMAPAPALPARSSLRKSKFLDNLVIPTKESTIGDQPPLSPATAPHSVYLSSEEDISSSADEYSDFDLDFESDEPKSPEQRHSHQDTARIVSYVFQGKPSIVQVSRRSVSPTSLDFSPPKKLQRTATEPKHLRHSSTTSTVSTSILNFGRASTSGFSAHTKNSPSFLSIDPFAGKNEIKEEGEGWDRPKTPTALLKRTFTLNKKKSKPFLNQARSRSRDNLSIHTTPSMADLSSESNNSSPRLSMNQTFPVSSFQERRTPQLPPSAPPLQIMSRPSSTASRLRKISVSLGRRKLNKN